MFSNFLAQSNAADVLEQGRVFTSKITSEPGAGIRVLVPSPDRDVERVTGLPRDFFILYLRVAFALQHIENRLVGMAVHVGRLSRIEPTDGQAYRLGRQVHEEHRMLPLLGIIALLTGGLHALVDELVGDDDVRLGRRLVKISRGVRLGQKFSLHG